MSADVRRCYLRGASIAGWVCAECEAEYPHKGHPRVTYAGFLLHKIAVHRALPKLRPWTLRKVTANTYEIQWNSEVSS